VGKPFGIGVRSNLRNTFMLDGNPLRAVCKEMDEQRFDAEFVLCIVAVAWNPLFEKVT
jgi:hypothetical protein